MYIIIGINDYKILIEKCNKLQNDNDLLLSKIKSIEENLKTNKEMEAFLITQMSFLKQELENCRLKEKNTLEIEKNPFVGNKKHLFDYKNKIKIKKIKKQIRNEFLEQSKKLKSSLGISISKLTLTNEDDVLKINYIKKNDNNRIEIKDNNYRQYLDILIKDMLHISDKSWDFLKLQLGLDIDSHAIIQKKRKTLNLQFELNECNEGFYIDPQHAITQKLNELYEQNSALGKEIIIKISADGTVISRNIKVINVVFSIINEKTKATTASGTYLLGIFPYKKESNDEIQKWLPIIWDKLKNLKKITINSNEFAITYIFCSDYKMMLNVLGMKQANSVQPCIWCESGQNDLHMKGTTRKEILLNNSNNLNQDIDLFDDDDIIDDHFYNERVSNNHSQTNRLLKEITLENFVVDILHLFLRITERLGHCLIQEMADDLSMTTNYDPLKHTSIKKLILFLKETCRINVLSLKYTKNTIDYIFTRMQGPEKIRMFNYIIKDNKFLKLLKECKIKYADRKVKLWKVFYKIIIDIKDNTITYDLSKACNKWLKEFIFLNEAKKITPYIHIFAFHVPDQIKKHGTLAYYECQGLEKFNDLSTRIFFHSTNKHDWVRQMMLKNLRVQKLSSMIKLKSRRKYGKQNEIDVLMKQKAKRLSTKKEANLTAEMYEYDLIKIVQSQNLMFQKWLAQK